MKLTYRNLTICSKQELQGNPVPAALQELFDKEKQEVQSCLQLYVLLDKIYAGSLQVRLLEQDTVFITEKLPDIGKNAAALQSRCLSMLLFYIFHRWDMKNAFMEPERKEPLFIENLELLGFQRLSDDEQNRLYLLKRDAFKTALEPDAQELQRMSLQQLWQLFPIVIRPYSARYKDWYDTQCQCLQTLLKDQIVRISHIGSTAVPGLEAKPCIDILLETDTRYPQALIQTLMENGWGLMSRRRDAQGEILCFHKGYTVLGFAEQVFHLHVRYPHDWDELYFRDYLLTHEDACCQYANLKKKLARKYRRDRDAYTQEKTAFITEITNKSRKASAGKYMP